MDATLWERAFLIRRAERRLLELFTEGRLSGTVHTCLGQELSAVAVAAALKPGDAVFSNHRGHGHFLAHTGDLQGLFAEVLGKASGVCGGRGGSQHLHAAGFFSNGILGGMAPSAAGAALARQLGAVGGICVLFLGDGALGEGVVYEALNLAGRWKLPLLVVVEDNGIAQSTPQAQGLSGSIEGRARAFGLDYFPAGTSSPDVLLEQARQAAGRARLGMPALLHVETARLAPHSKGDDDRKPEDVRLLTERDPLTLLERDQPDLSEKFEAAARRAVAAAFSAADACADAVPAATAQASAGAPRWRPLENPPDERGGARVYAALKRALEKDQRLLLLGCDIEAPYGGAFKATKDLSVLFPGRVRNTPVSEAALVGMAAGLALEGWRPVVEIMFGDFLALTLDQWLNHAAKFGELYGLPLPLVVRAPMGGGRGYGPTHSQSLEKHFLGVPGTSVVALNGRWDPAAVYAAVFSVAAKPTLVLENKQLYAAKVSGEAPAGFSWERTDDALPTLRLKPRARPELTLVAAGGALALAEQGALRLFEEDELAVEVICPTRLYPLDFSPIAQSLSRTGRLLCVEEGQGFSGFGAEVLAQACEALGPKLQGARRAAAFPSIIPCAPALERAVLPGLADVLAAAREAVNG